MEVKEIKKKIIDKICDIEQVGGDIALTPDTSRVLDRLCRDRDTYYKEVDILLENFEDLLSHPESESKPEVSKIAGIVNRHLLSRKIDEGSDMYGIARDIINELKELSPESEEKVEFTKEELSRAIQVVTSASDIGGENKVTDTSLLAKFYNLLKVK